MGTRLAFKFLARFSVGIIEVSSFLIPSSGRAWSLWVDRTAKILFRSSCILHFEYLAFSISSSCKRIFPAKAQHQAVHAYAAWRDNFPEGRFQRCQRFLFTIYTCQHTPTNYLCLPWTLSKDRQSFGVIYTSTVFFASSYVHSFSYTACIKISILLRLDASENDSVGVSCLCRDSFSTCLQLYMLWTPIR